MLLLFSFQSIAQTSVIKGKVTDADSKEVLIGVSVVTNTKNGTATDVSGKYSLPVKPGKYKLTYKYVGYADVVKEIVINEGEVHTLDVALKVQVHAIDEIVVSAGKFEQKLSDVTVSLEVLKPARIEAMNTTTLDKAINQIPGVDVSGEQPSIRGGSGYSYGAGSRVLVMVDDLPMLSPSSGDAKWNFLPLENITQIEVIKGASSSLFGSSALNGVINLRTAFPGNEPETKITSYSGIYLQPKNKNLIWKNNSPQLFTATYFNHSHKFGNLDVVFGGEVYGDNGFRQEEFERHTRFNANLRYRDKKIKGLSYGTNFNYMFFDKQDFFLWRNADSAYHQNLAALSEVLGTRLNVDPFVTFVDSSGNKLSFRSRYYHEGYENAQDSSKNSRSDMIYGDLQYQKNIKDNLNITAGTTIAYSEVKSELFGNHYGGNVSFYAQADKKIHKLSISAGFRIEYAKVDSTQTVSQFKLESKGKMLLDFPFFPVARLGLSYQLAKFTYLRGSYGQGYRFPSIAELYTKTSLGGLNIFPNSSLTPETGESLEIGAKQGVKISNWSGYIDVAGFYTKYNNMMEYTFGFYPPSKGIFFYYDVIGFKAMNVGKAEITGVDITLTGQGTIFSIPATILVGYTFTNPYDLSNDSSKSTSNRILKYRSYHSAKGDVELSYKRFSMGVSFIYSSKVINIDKAFEEPIPATNIYILPGLKEYREANNKGYIVFDHRVSYEVSEHAKVSLVTKNIFNKEYMGRPGDVRPPRSISLQLSMKF